MNKKRVLFVSQEIKPFLPNSDISTASRLISQAVQEDGKEIRVFMPKFGMVNERRHQLHEVIRLSGMNLIIDDTDHPLIIKVASIPTARMQVYFIDNDEYYRRKGLYGDDEEEEFKDNDERSMFFCKGVLETVKKLGWKPDVVHCQGWMTALMPLYIKDLYKDDPHFTDTKVVYSVHDQSFNNIWDNRFEEKLKFEGFNQSVIDSIKGGDFVSLNKAAMDYADGVTINTYSENSELRKVFEDCDTHKLELDLDEFQPKDMTEFFNKVINEEEVIQ